MTANINVQNKPVIPEQVKPTLKAVADPSAEIETEISNNSVIKIAKAEQKPEVSNVNKAEQTSENEPPKQTLDDAVKQLNSYVQSINRNLEFNIDTDNGETIVRVVDAETEELIRQIPNEEALSMTKQLAEKSISEPGLLLTKLQA